MDTKETEFLKRLQATFRVEAEEQLHRMSACLLELEKSPESAQPEVVETVFREAHSLKGSARTVNVKDVESICHHLESAFSALKKGDLALSPHLFDLFNQTVNHLTRLALSKHAERSTSDRALTNDLILRLGKALEGEPRLPQKTEPSAGAAETSPEAAFQPWDDKAISLETVRIPTSALDPLLFQAEEMITAKMAAGQRAVELLEINQALLAWKTETTKWKDQAPGASSVQWKGWAETNETRLNDVQHLTAVLARAFEQDRRVLGRMVDDHLEGMKKVLMLPMATMVEAFPRLVRDLTRSQGKEADFILRGAEIEIDKRILEELKEPLIHLIRNCVDHGLKTPDERKRLNKPEQGTVTLAIEVMENRQVEIAVSDDGTGLDPERLRSAAIKAGILSREEAQKLDRPGALSLVFHSGVSTSPFVTDISGRGLGLAIVREKVEKLGGSVSVDSQPQMGTTFRLLLPMTLATFRGVLARVGEHEFVLPTVNIERAARVRPEEIETVKNRETIKLDGRILSLARLGDVLGLTARREETAKGANQSDAYLTVVVLVSGEKSIAFQVDEVLGERQVLVKNLGRQLDRVRNIAGATILGSGKVAPVLNVTDLIKSAVRFAGAPAPEVEAEAAAKVEHILVAEDSITARALIKSILESAGYRVSVAVDGLDAFTQLRGGEFDLIVSDVDMPRMSGFELTAKIRADKKLNELPVVLVTALESREDKEHGIEVGANAYIVKSRFEQSNLLEVVGRMI